MATDIGPPWPSDDRRREFRAFVKANHPDAGGDPDVFVAGLRHWQQRPSPEPGPVLTNVVFHRRPRGTARFIGWWPARRRPSRRVH